MKELVDKINVAIGEFSTNANAQVENGNVIISNKIKFSTEIIFRDRLITPEKNSRKLFCSQNQIKHIIVIMINRA